MTCPVTDPARPGELVHSKGPAAAEIRAQFGPALAGLNYPVVFADDIPLYWGPDLAGLSIEAVTPERSRSAIWPRADEVYRAFPEIPPLVDALRRHLLKMYPQPPTAELRGQPRRASGSHSTASGATTRDRRIRHRYNLMAKAYWALMDKSDDKPSLEQVAEHLVQSPRTIDRWAADARTLDLFWPPPRSMATEGAKER